MLFSEPFAKYLSVLNNNSSPSNPADPDVEIICDRILMILNRKSKNRPAMISEDKHRVSTIMANLVSRFDTGKVPDRLQNSLIVKFDIDQFLDEHSDEALGLALFQIAEEAAEYSHTRRHTILFFDQVHRLVSVPSPYIRDPNVTSNALLQLTIRCRFWGLGAMGTSTLSAWQEHMDPHPGIERHWQGMFIE